MNSMNRGWANAGPSRSVYCLISSALSAAPLRGLARIDILSAANEHVVGSTHEKVESIQVFAHQIAGQVPAVAHSGRGGLRLIQVSAHQRRRAQCQNAVVLRSTVDELAADIGERVTERQRRPRKPVRMRSEHGGSRLGRAEA